MSGETEEGMDEIALQELVDTLRADNTQLRSENARLVSDIKLFRGNGWATKCAENMSKMEDDNTQLRKEVESVENAVDEQWLDAIATQWHHITGNPWETRDGECREEGVQANINALFQHIEDTNATLDRYRVALEKCVRVVKSCRENGFCVDDLLVDDALSTAATLERKDVE